MIIRAGRFMTGRALVGGLAFALCAPALSAQPVVEELGWVLEREIPFANPIAPLLNPEDGLIYAGERGQDVYVVDADGVRTKVVDTDDVAGLEVDPRNGDLYMSEDFPGNIKKIVYGSGLSPTWVNGFDGGDDDPVGICFVPEDYTGTLLTPGGMVSTDRGYGSDQEVWAWLTSTGQGEIELVNTATELVDPVDIAVRADGVIAIADQTGGVALLGDDASITPLATTPAMVDVQAVAFDTRSDDLFALDKGVGGVVRIDLATGAATPVVTGIVLSGTNWGSLNVSPGPETQRLIVGTVDEDKIYVFGAVPGCNDADLSVPFGLLDLADVTLFVTAFLGQNPYADFDGNGLWDLADVLTYVDAFTAGCP